MHAQCTLACELRTACAHGQPRLPSKVSFTEVSVFIAIAVTEWQCEMVLCGCSVRLRVSDDGRVG